MRPSRLYGTLELPGQKAYPSKDFDYWNVNPDQGIFEIKSALVRPKLSNGQEWNHFGKPMPKDTVDKFPHLKPGSAWPLSLGTGAYGSVAKASNPETITGFGILPEYPEEQRIRELLDQTPKIKQEKIALPIPKLTAELPAEFKLREKYSQDKIDRLVRLGFSEELIGQAIEEEAKKDLMKVLKNPGLFNEAIVAQEIEKAYEKYVTRSGRTGTGAAGEGPSSAVQSPGVRAYSAAAAAAEASEEGAALPARTSRLARLRAKESARREATDIEELLESGESGPLDSAAGRLFVGALGKDDYGVFGGIGGGAGASATSGSLLESRMLSELRGGAAAAGGAAVPAFRIGGMGIIPGRVMAQAIEVGGRPAGRPYGTPQSLEARIAIGEARRQQAAVKRAAAAAKREG